MRLRTGVGTVERALDREAAPAPGRDTAEAEEAANDLLDVPAAVVCASCGDPGCPGCCDARASLSASGVIAIIPWERPGRSMLAQLWNTARLATSSCETFFGSLPDGSVAWALRFAVLAELLAIAGLGAALLPLFLLVAPELLTALLHEPELRSVALRFVAAGLPALAAIMVGIHALHGYSLDIAARRAGCARQTSRSLRFGMYACGWDLVTLPAGLAIVAVMDGLGAVRAALPLGWTAPARAAHAYLRSAYRLDEAKARQASRFALAITASVVFGGTTLAAVAVSVAALS
jgi:hypothetical protein